MADTSIDSLHLLWNKEKDAVSKFSIGRRLTHKYIFADLDMAYRLSDTMLILGQQIGGYEDWSARYLRSDVLRRMGEAPESLILLLGLLEEAQLQEWVEQQAMVYQVIGLIYASMEEWGKSILYLNKSIDAFSSEKKGAEIFAMGDLAEVYLLSKDSSSARRTQLEMIQLAEKNKNLKVIEHILFWIEELDIISQQCTYSEDELKQVLHYSRVVENNYYELSFSLIKMKCLSEKGKFAELAEFGEKIRQKFKIYKGVQFELEYYKLMDQAYMQLGNWKKAYEMLNERNGLERQAFDKRKRASIADYELKYQEFQNVKLQQENLNALNDRKQAQKLNIILLFLFVALILLFWVLWERREMKQKLEKEQLQHQVWKLQFNPHFFFNALTSIQAFLYQKNADKAVRAINRLSGLFRQALNRSELEWTDLNEELKFIQEYVTFHQFISGDQFDFKIIIEESIKCNDLQVPPLILQPIIENAIKHGLHEKEEKGQLYLEIYKQGGVIKTCIRNNGAKFKVMTKRKPSSLGLKITNKRLQNYKLNQNKNRIMIENNVRDGENWVEVSFLLPYRLQTA